MASIYYKANNYTGDFAHINTPGIQEISCTKLDLMRAIITVGSPSFITWDNIKDYGFLRTLYNSVIEKAGYITNIDIQNNIMVRHSIYDNFVSDKKRIVSYNIGMAFAKFYSQKLFDIPDLIHVETLKKQDAITFLYDDNDDSKRREPDLVGSTSSDKWHIFEAKGMSSNNLNRQILSAKEQVAMVETIHGHLPETSNACATYIATDRITTYLDDPEPYKKKSIKIKEDKFIESYYALATYLNQNHGNMRRETINDIKVVTFPLVNNNSRLDLQLSIEEEIFENLQDDEFSKINKSRNKMKEYSGASETDISIGIDGYIVTHKNRKLKSIIDDNDNYYSNSASQNSSSYQ